MNDTEQERLESLQIARAQKSQAATVEAKASETQEADQGLHPMYGVEWLLWLLTFVPAVGPAAKFLIKIKRFNAIEGLFTLISFIPVAGPIFTGAAKIYKRISR